ncbi:hypothetical protein Q3G72_002807 [Acer saccharum]|nr:hypothetical protein Q3G72_002807 [Acer saccharum]
MNMILIRIVFLLLLLLCVVDHHLTNLVAHQTYSFGPQNFGRGLIIMIIIWYKLAYSFNYSYILYPLTKNNYQLFMVERLILMGAKTFIKTYKEDDNNLSLTDDPKKNTKNRQILVFSTHCMTVMTLVFCGMTVMSRYIHIVNQNLVAS